MKKFLNPLPLLKGIFISLIPLCITILIVFPESREWFITHKDIIIKNTAIGLTIFPVFLWVVLKGGLNWHKKFSSWFTFVLSGCAIVGIVLFQAYGGTLLSPSSEETMLDFENNNINNEIHYENNNINNEIHYKDSIGGGGGAIIIY